MINFTSLAESLKALVQELEKVQHSTPLMKLDKVQNQLKVVGLLDKHTKFTGYWLTQKGQRALYSARMLLKEIE